MLEAAIASGLHILSVGLVFVSLTLRTVHLHGTMDAAGVQRVLRWDNGYGIVTILLYTSAFWRLFGELEKPLDFYTGSWVFWAKMGVIGMMATFEMFPMVTFIGWRVRIKRGEEPDLRRLGLLRACHIGELSMLPILVFLAAFMVRGYGQMDVATLPVTVVIAGVEANPASGRDTYGAMCAPCHGVDGTGHGGTLAADFTRATVHTKTDDQLLGSIRDGVPGTSMPAWGEQLDEAHRRDVLAYIRATFDPGP